MSSSRDRPKRETSLDLPGSTALALCAGGITGGVYEIGALLALEDFFVDFGPAQFDSYVGTSAGALIATLAACGVSARTMADAICDHESALVPLRRQDVFQVDGMAFAKGARDFAVILGRSVARAARSRHFRFSELLLDLEDALPAGLFSMGHFEAWLEQVFLRYQLPRTFAEVPRHLYITANDLDRGKRVVFGEAGHRDIPLPKAICASSAIPLFFEPVEWKGRDYVDGAAGKAGHLDVVLRKGAELVVVINPRVPAELEHGKELPTLLLGKRHIREKGLITVYEQCQRMSVRTKLHEALRRYRLQFPKATILLIEPQVSDVDMLLANPMNFQARKRVLRYGYDSAARQLIARHEEFSQACARHRIQTSVDRLGHRPWDLAG